MSRSQALTIIAASIIMIIIYGKIDYGHPDYIEWDLHKYLSMAKAFPSLDPKIPAPFAYRILGPWIVALLPIQEETAFRVLTIVFSLLLVVIFSHFLIRSGISPPAATFTMICFICNRHFFGFPIWDYFQLNDIILLIGFILIFYAVQSGKWALFGFTIFLTILAKETVLIAIPTFIIYLIESGALRKYWKLYMLSILPAVVAFLLVRKLINAPGIGLFESLILYVGKLKSPSITYGLIINSFAPLSLLPFVYWRRTTEFFLRRKYILVYMLLVFVGTLFANNNERLMAPAFIGFYWLVARIVQDDLYPDKVILLITICLTFISGLNYRIDIFRLPGELPFMIVPFVSTCLLTIIVLARKRRIIQPEKAG